MDHGNEGVGTDSLAAIQQVESVKTVMNNNMQRVLEKGEQLENIEGRTEALTQSSQNFQWAAQRSASNVCEECKMDHYLCCLCDGYYRCYRTYYTEQLCSFRSLMIMILIKNSD